MSEDWKTLDDTLDQFESALNDAGLQLSDMEGLAQGDIPQDVDRAKLATLGEDLQKLDGEDVQKASDDIETHAEDECGIDLGASGGEPTRAATRASEPAGQNTPTASGLNDGNTCAGDAPNRLTTSSESTLRKSVVTCTSASSVSSRPGQRPW